MICFPLLSPAPGEPVGRLNAPIVNNTKEAERAELHKTIWRIANDLRGSVDGWDFKSYVLGMLFYRFISANITAYLNDEAHRAGDTSFDYAALSDADAEQGRAETVKEKGFYILPSHLFGNVRRRTSSRRIRARRWTSRRSTRESLGSWHGRRNCGYRSTPSWPTWRERRDD